MNLALWIPVLLFGGLAAGLALAWWRLSKPALAALVLGAVVAALLGEWGLRTLHVANPGRAVWLESYNRQTHSSSGYTPDSVLIYRYPDNPRGYFDAENKVVGHINALGYRGALRGVERTPGLRRIAMLGDSFTLGIGVRDEHTLPAQLERELGPQTLEVLNFGISGTDTPEQVNLLVRKVLEYAPDLVVLVFFLNDAERGPTMEYLTRPHALISLRRHSFLLNGLVGVLERALLRGEMRRHYREGYAPESAGWQRARAALVQARDVLAERGTPLVVVVHPILVDLERDAYPFTSIHETVLAFCREQDIATADLIEVLAGRRDRDLWVHANDQHPNERAHAVSAAWLAEWLRAHDLAP